MTDKLLFEAHLPIPTLIEKIKEQLSGDEITELTEILNGGQVESHQKAMCQVVEARNYILAERDEARQVAEELQKCIKRLAEQYKPQLGDHFPGWWFLDNKLSWQEKEDESDS